MSTTTSTKTKSTAVPSESSTAQSSVAIVAPDSAPHSRQNSSASLAGSWQGSEAADSKNPQRKAHPPATSVLLQGSAKLADKLLWLFPDGSGSAAPYTTLGRVKGNVAVLGLQCPYMRSAEKWKCGLRELTPSYIDEIRRRQPEGPYYLGGWFTGGILAFEAARELHSAGQKIARLTLIDTPCPMFRKWKPSALDEELMDVIPKELNGKELPEWMHRHYDASLKSLKKYRVRPFEPYEEPVTDLIYAGRGVCQTMHLPQFTNIDDSEPDEVKFVVSERKEFDAGGWDKLLDPEGIQVAVIEDADHFSMMQGDGGQKLAELLSKLLA